MLLVNKEVHNIWKSVKGVLFEFSCLLNIHILTNPVYFDKPCIPCQTFHALTNPSYHNIPYILWQTLHTLLNPAYHDKPFIPWQTLHTITNPTYFDKSCIFWKKNLYTLTNLSCLDKPCITWHTKVDISMYIKKCRTSYMFEECERRRDKNWQNSYEELLLKETLWTALTVASLYESFSAFFSPFFLLLPLKSLLCFPLWLLFLHLLYSYQAETAFSAPP